MAERNKKSELGFGFNPTESAHHFVLLLTGKGDSGTAEIEERYSYGDTPEALRPETRARLDGYTWGRVSESVQTHFNRRLKDTGRKSAQFASGENLLAPYIGKELTLLFWALEGVDPTDLPNALSNWLSFVPEERWWMYTTVKSSGAGPDGHSGGWRKAIRIAFAESPAPPPAEGARGFNPETLPPSKMDDESSKGIATEEPAAVQSERRTKSQSLSLFE